jgi:hypothetical protein
MLSKKLFRLIHKIALFAIVFASLAPSISHAIAAQNNANGFLQEVCTSTGKKVQVQISTTQGKQLATEFSVKQSPTDTVPKNVGMHLEHCPFCASHAVAAALPTNNLEIIALLEVTAQKAAEYAAPVVVSHPYYVSPPSQAPPSL